MYKQINKDLLALAEKTNYASIIVEAKQALELAKTALQFQNFNKALVTPLIQNILEFLGEKTKAQFTWGYEYSPVIYVKIPTWEISEEEWKILQEKLCQWGKQAKADEGLDKSIGDHSHRCFYIWRFWWD